VTLRLYNTLTRGKEDFVPLDPANVRMYVCGPTVYDLAHIGNARPVIVFDVLYRLLRHLAAQGAWDGGQGRTKVTYVRNITDVDDKINARAAEQGIEIRELTEVTARQFREDAEALGCLPPDVEPRATEHIAEMIALVERLVASGHAYAAEGHVLFNVPSMPDYGRLSRRSLDELVAGARVEVAPYKRDPQDFVLWKPSKPGDPAWESPWGSGRPGWHIECSAMAAKHLGETFDIHGGGIDLVFPHHENEIAQSRCAHRTDLMAKVWMHNGFLQVEGDKMSKSLGNFVTIRELLQDWPGELIRLNMLKTHYRQPMDWTVKGLEESEKNLRRWRRHLSEFPAPDRTPPDRRFLDRLSDDLNTPLAISVLNELSGEASTAFSVGRPPSASPRDRDRAREEAAAALRGSLALIGISEVEEARSATVDEHRVEALIETRRAARAAKNWAESDRIRDELAAMGVVLKDTPQGTTWEIAR